LRFGCAKAWGDVVLKNEHGYKGVAYSLTDLGNERWNWAFYPRKGDGPAHRGEAVGTREHAEIACMSAINNWLRQNANSDATA
jgi:hypothetical protein